ncbi:hypothetical protein ACKUB1_14280 [Methanospirillum stamsii]|uniref:Uncharacterized protein n=1 Tax=Methanospirillum stamsii TaxID=1277351 RepID=A0A2V2MZU6_9EURY|nr:hypothetical protein [Methanospirillum stamsii]PWR71860.1 hypothetical protein DLD82_13365 [Methanospirillum stamsii]
MGYCIHLGILCSLVLVFCTGFCSAAESSSALIYIQGSGSAITNGSNGMIIMVKDVVPYFHITDGVESKLVPVESLTDISYPAQAVVKLFNAENETNSIIQVLNLSLSDENKVLTLNVNPLEYYEGEMLKSLVNGQELTLDEINGEYNRADIYLEAVWEAPSNALNCNPCFCCDFGGSGECGDICTCCTPT